LHALSTADALGAAFNSTNQVAQRQAPSKAGGEEQETAVIKQPLQPHKMLPIMASVEALPEVAHGLPATTQQTETQRA